MTATATRQTGPIIDVREPVFWAGAVGCARRHLWFTDGNGDYVAACKSTIVRGSVWADLTGDPVCASCERTTIARELRRGVHRDSLAV